MLEILISIAISFTVTYYAIPAIISIANHKKLYDVPDVRKVHVTPIPSLGGIAIFAGFSLSCLYAIAPSNTAGIQYFIAASIVIFFLGLKDDIMIISPLKKLIGQMMATFLVVYKGGVQLQSMHGFLGINEIPEVVSLPLTYFTILVIINSFNLIDGIDGLAGCLGVMVTALTGFYFYHVNMMPFAILALSLCSSLVAFLIYNYHPAKIFMGDTGSLLLGLISSILVIKFINVAPTQISFPISASPAVGFSILIIPLLDTLRVFFMRVVNRRSPFSPDRNHIHHILLDKGLSHPKIALTLLCLNLLFVMIAYSGRGFGSTWLISLFVFMYFVSLAFLKYFSAKPRESVKPQNKPSLKLISSTKIITLANDSVRIEKGE